MEEEADCVITAIRAAFRGVERGEITLHEGQALDDYATEQERAHARLKDDEESWEFIPHSAIMDCPNALTYLDARSWRYYIPAHMIWAIRHCASDESMLRDFTIYSLLGDMDGRFALLTRRQSEAVFQFLHHMLTQDCDETAVRRALDSHWSRFGEDRNLPA